MNRNLKAKHIMATTKTPTFEQLVKFVKDNELNVFNEYSEQHNDNIETVLDAETYAEENYNTLVEQWQKEQPCNLTVEEIDRIYDRAFAKLKTMRGNANYWFYAINVCQRLLDYKMSKINQKYSH